MSSPSARRCEWGVHAELLSGLEVTTGARVSELEGTCL